MTSAAGPRFHSGGLTLVAGAEVDLPEATARHVMVRRLQPGDALRLFDGASGRDWPAAVVAITRRAVSVRLGGAAVAAAAGELPLAVTLAFGMPANERIDALVEKATELGVSALQPLSTERTVLKLAGERAARKREHWQAIAVSACEQCGRARVPEVHAVRALDDWLRDAVAAGATRWVMHTDRAAPPWGAAWPAAQPPRRHAAAAARVVLLSGPEGGFSADEMQRATDAGFAPVSLGPRVLRADTAPLAALAWLALSHCE